MGDITEFQASDLLMNSSFVDTQHDPFAKALASQSLQTEQLFNGLSKDASFIVKFNNDEHSSFLKDTVEAKLIEKCHCIKCDIDYVRYALFEAASNRQDFTQSNATLNV